MIITEAGHCWVTFKNGYILSIFNGKGSYTENLTNMDLNATRYESKKIEVAVMVEGMFCTRQFFDYNIDDDVTTIEVYDLPELINKINDKEPIELGGEE